MGMGLYTQPGVYVSSWIDMKSDVAMRYEVDHFNDAATLYFGSGEEYVLDIGQHTLDQLLGLCNAAKRELATPPVEDQ